MVKALLTEQHSIFGNPWRADQWNITRQGQFVARYGAAKAAEFAKAAGSPVHSLRPPTTTEVRIVEARTYIMTKKIGQQQSSGGGTGGTGGSGGLVGAGSSGDGPPE